jgi:DNA-binding NarL/FixJ family response regulator
MAEHSILLIGPEENAAAKIEKAVCEAVEGAIEWLKVDALFDALRNLQERSYDLIITDLFLPDGQGLATVRHLNQQAPQTPVIVLASTKDRDIAVNAVRKGAHDFFCYEDMDIHAVCRAVTRALTREKSDAGTGADRRTNARFPCRLAVSYQALEHPFISGVATSETLNISSKGMLFATDHALRPGQLLQVSVDWPARLENQVPLKLVAEGRIVRHRDGLAAMSIDKYEFRTRKVKPQNGTPAGSSIPKPSRPAETAGTISTQPGPAAGNRKLA